MIDFIRYIDMMMVVANFLLSWIAILIYLVSFIFGTHGPMKKLFDIGVIGMSVLIMCSCLHLWKIL